MHRRRLLSLCGVGLAGLAGCAGETPSGDARGWFVGALNRTGPSIAYTPVTGTAFEVGAGETETWTHVDDSIGSSGTATYRFRTASERRQTSVEVE